jgi:hypothetical protein
MSPDPVLLQKTPVGVLGTVGSWHRRSPGFSLHHLGEWVRSFGPDIVCAEIPPAVWEAGRVAALGPEYRECLVPLCRELGIIIVPVGDGWRGRPSLLRLALVLGAGPAWVNSTVADSWHRASAWLGPDSTQANHALIGRVLETVHRDPGRRVLVTVRVERRYAVRDGLCRMDEVSLVPVRRFWRGCTV